MSVKVAINGFGRIGRLAFRMMFDDNDFEVVALNDLTDAEQLAYLLKYDSSQGSYDKEVSFEGSDLIVDGRKFRVYSERDPHNLPWKKLDVDIVLECTGIFRTKEKAGIHLEAGAKRVMLSAPAKGDVPTFVYNVNCDNMKADDTIVSAASCTTNCLAPIAKILDDKFTIKKGLMTTVHAYTSDQPTLDSPHQKGIYARRGRAAAQNIIPTSTGAAAAVGLVLPQLNGKLDGMALRVPVSVGSIVDLTVELGKNVTVEEINEAVKAAQSDTIGYTEDPIVSSDVIGNTNGTLFDGNSTKIVEENDKQLVKVLSWYDNESSFTAQMIRLTKKMANLI